MSPRGRLTVALLSTSIVCYVVVGAWLGRVFGDSSYAQLSIFGEVVNLVMTSYVEPVNLERTMRGAQLGLTEALDGDSAYLDAAEFKELQQRPRGNEADVGLVITRRFGFLMVVAPRPGSPAARAGLRPGDILKTIDGHHSRPLSVPAGERLLRGAPGSQVRLTVLRSGNDPLDFTLVRETPNPVAPETRMAADGIGYLKLAEFSDHAADEVRSALDGLRRSGARRLVLDLRGAAAGSLNDASKVAELFLKGGVVARIHSRHDADQVLNADPSRTSWELPLAVLIDTGTAGPGEIVAGALLDNDRGPLVGSHTFGRAAVQRAIPLYEGGLWLTVAKYQTPKGENIHGHGIEPTVAVKRGDDEEEGEEATPPGDPALDKALELLRSVERKAADLGSERLRARAGRAVGSECRAA